MPDIFSVKAYPSVQKCGKKMVLNPDSLSGTTNYSSQQ